MPLIEDLKKLLGVKDMDEKNALSLVSDHVKGLADKNEELDKKVKELSAKPKDDKDKDAKPADEPKQLSAVELGIVEDRAEIAQDKLNALLGKPLDPASVKAFSDLFIGQSGDRNVFALSRQGATEPLARTVIDLLGKIKPIVMTEKTGLQALSRETPGGEEKKEPDPKEIEARAKMAMSHVSGK